MMIMIADEAQTQMRLFVQLEANSVEAAQQVEQISRGMLSFASLSRKTPEIAPLLKACSLSRTDASLSFEFRYVSADLLALMKRFAPKENYYIETEKSPSLPVAFGGRRGFVFCCDFCCKECQTQYVCLRMRHSKPMSRWCNALPAASVTAFGLLLSGTAVRCQSLPPFKTNTIQDAEDIVQKLFCGLFKSECV
jgi:hypothetical protein